MKTFLNKNSYWIFLPVVLMGFFDALALSPLADYYRSFDELSKVEVLDRDFRIKIVDRSTDTIVLGIHGGHIEFGTSEIVAHLSALDLSYYLFEGLRSSDNRRLHITSDSFDEPGAIEIVSLATTALSIHGFKEESRPIVCVGGMNVTLGKELVSVLSLVDFWIVEFPCLKYPGSNRNNIVNRAKFHGVQLELSSLLRKNLLEGSVPKVVEI